MKKLMGIPGEEGYSMPGEFEPHRGCIMIWPKRPGSWNYGAVKAREAFKNVAHAIAESEDVYMLAEPDVAEDARRALGVTGEAAAETPGTGARIHVLEMGSDDAWARDVGPTFVKNRAGASTGNSTPGAEPWTVCTPIGKKTTRWRSGSVRPWGMSAMRPIPLCWRAAPSTATARGPSW